ncbi:MAG: hypothetical protein GY743_08330 [Planctomycetaceae bacterium]|nr:hypothetical protein [Planctomycetaceae bacterium]
MKGLIVQSFSSPKYRLLVASLVTVLIAGAMLGCQNQDQASSLDGTRDSAPMDGPSGTEIVHSTLQTYRTAERYQDAATFRISYQLLGKYLEEPHPWSVSFWRNQGLQADIFESRIRADNQQLACFVFDFASGNLDDQWLIQERKQGLPLGSLFQDGICRHYMTGHDDLPIKPNHAVAADVFFPPTLALLTEQTELKWLRDGQATRITDASILGKPFYQVQIEYERMLWQVVIDPSTYLIRNITYPNELLDSQLQDNPEVKHLQVVADFTNATLEPTFQSVDFQLDIPAAAKTVRNFIPVPQTFPSSYLGKTIQAIGLRNSQDQPIDQKDWSGKVNLLCWTNQAIKEKDLLATLKELQEKLPASEYSIHRIEIVSGTLPGNPAVTKQLTQLEQTDGIPTLADYTFSCGRKLGLHHYPMLAVVNQQGVLQYVKSLQDDTISTNLLANILQRVHSGDDIAEEMRLEYASFLDLYRERLTTVAVNQGAAEPTPLSNIATPTHMTVEPLWRNTDFQQPGNLRLAKENELTMLDGWRTVIQLDAQGKEISRKELDLDPQESISIVRTGDKQKELSVVYSTMGRTVRVLDQNLTPIQIVEVNNDQQRIRDANLFDFDNDGQDELLISFTGPRGTEIIDATQPNDTRRISSQSLRSATVLQRPDNQKTLVFCDPQAKLRFIDSGNSQVQYVPCDLVAATRIIAKPSGDETLLCAIGTDTEGRWMAVGLNDALQQTWAVPIGNQRFETQIDPIAYAYTKGNRRGLWVIASAEKSLKLITDDGKIVDEWRIGKDLHGLELTTAGQNFVVILSTNDDVQAWTLSTTPPSALPASAKN